MKIADLLKMDMAECVDWLTEHPDMELLSMYSTKDSQQIMDSFIEGLGELERDDLLDYFLETNSDNVSKLKKFMGEK